MTVLALLGVVLVLFVAAVLSTREGQVLADAPPDAVYPALPSGPLQPEDLIAVRFDMALRGYRMSQVDEVLQRLTGELRSRDERIAALEEAQGPRGPAAIAAQDRTSSEASPP